MDWKATVGSIIDLAAAAAAAAATATRRIPTEAARARREIAKEGDGEAKVGIVGEGWREPSR